MIIFSFQNKIVIKGLRHDLVNLFLVTELKGRGVQRLVNQERMERKTERQREDHPLRPDPTEGRTSPNRR
jgi:hypothetical protein